MNSETAMDMEAAVDTIFDSGVAIVIIETTKHLMSIWVETQ